MTTTIEETLQLLAGDLARPINIRIDYADRTLVKSLSRQIAKFIPLTDRQLDLAVRKIEKYSDGLKSSGIDVDALLRDKPLSMPLRIVDRSQTLTLENSLIVIRYAFSKKFDEAWKKIKGNAVGAIRETKNCKEALYNEKNVVVIVSALEPLGFTIDQALLDIMAQAQTILDVPMDHIPHVAYENNAYEIKNVHPSLATYATSLVGEITDENLHVSLDRLKWCGVFERSVAVRDKLTAMSFPEIVANQLAEPSTRYRVNPEKYSPAQLIQAVNTMQQWPVVVVLDDDVSAFRQLTEIHTAIASYVTSSEINVFFRLKSGQPNADKFNQYVQDNKLNNFIDANTKVVFITKTRIPKPLVKSEWDPKCAIVVAAHDYGKTTAFLNDIPVVYYYNDSITLKHSYVKGTRSIGLL